MNAYIIRALQIQVGFEELRLLGVGLGVVATALTLGTWIWRVARSYTVLSGEVDLLKKATEGLGELEHRLTVAETRLEPFVKVVEESMERLVKKGNPIELAVFKQIKEGGASLEMIDNVDAVLKKEFEESSDYGELVSIMAVRYWLALRRQEKSCVKVA